MVREVRRLLLLRHARAADAPGLVDVERPLTEQGELDAAEVGSWLNASGVLPDLVVCSTARRARRTWELAAAALETTPPASYQERIYHAQDESELLAAVREAGDAVGCLLLVGHNPTVHDLAVSLTAAEELRDGFPAGSLAVVSVAGEWAGLTPDVSALTTLVPPARVR